MATAIWVPVYGFEGLYEVSNSGIVRTVARPSVTNAKTSIIKKPFRKRGGSKPYWMVSLQNGGVAKNYSLHRVVFCSFNRIELRSSPSAKMVVCHLNDDIDDNRIENLKIQDRKQNMADWMRNKNAIRVPRPTDIMVTKENLVLSLVKGFLGIK